MKKVKILYIHHGTGIGGAPISLLNLVCNLNPEQYIIKVAFLRNSDVVDLFKEKNIDCEILNTPNIHFFHTETRFIKWYQFFKYFKIIYFWFLNAFYFAPRYLKNQKFDIVHLNSHVLSSWAFAAKKLKFKVIVHNRESVANGYFGIRRFLLQQILSYSTDKIINISKYASEKLGIIDKSVVIYNSVKIQNIVLRDIFKPTDKFKVLYLGGMVSIKGFNVIAQSLKYLDDNIVVQFVGSYGRLNMIDNNFKTKIINFIKLNFNKSLYRSLKLILESDKSEIIGVLKNTDQVIKNCDLLLSPFTVGHFSRPAIEAFSLGKAVIGSNVHGMDEIIDDKVNGLIIENGNYKELANKINFLSKNSEILFKLGVNARKKAENIFSDNVNLYKFNELYNSLTN